MNRLYRSLCILSVASVALTVSCVEHRPVRNGLKDETVYLDKAALTQVNPKAPDAKDDGWLWKVTVVKTSSPNVLGDYAWPGFESDLKYVKFRFSEDSLQVVDGRSLQVDDPANANDDLATRTDRVVMEFAGNHVDIKLRENLDGERTNYLEENTEEGWQKRQKFKVDLEKTSLDPITSMAWFYGFFLHDCAAPVSSRLVPGSFEYDAADQHMSWVVEANYEVSVLGGCYDMISLAQGVGTATIQYRFSFYRPGANNYQPELVAEKDAVNKKYGAFQVQNLFRDSKTGILSAQNLLQRWNPNRAEPVVFYFHKGFPERFKPMFQEMKTQTNAILQSSGAALRFDFKEWNADGIERHFGDIRYSFVIWHQDIDGTRGLLGYGPSSSDPRTGEVLSANLNLYNIGLDYYRYLIQDYLDRFGGKQLPAGKTKWEEVACQAGETVAPKTQDERLTSQLFSEMRRVMEINEATNTSNDFLPDPVRGKAAFIDQYHRVLPELRFTEPAYNPYTWRTTGVTPLATYRTQVLKEREFQTTLSKIASNENPFSGVAIHTRAGIEEQLAFRSKFNDWRKNHEKLEATEDFLLGLNNVYVFDAFDAISALSKGARKCTAKGVFETDDEYRERIIEDVVFHVGIHEFGHNLGLRHNFYGSVDAKHMKDGELSASVMDYVAAQEEAGSARAWGGYDAAALTWIYGNTAKRDEVMKQDFLYCTDEHRSRSPLCRAHDLGITPSQITLNSIERYDHLYDIRNHRAYRTFWDTSGYSGAVYNAIFPLQRFHNLALFDWGYGGVQDTLKRLDQIQGSVKSDREYDELAADFYSDVSAAVNMQAAFYDAVINQAAAFRNYQTEFDPFYGDILQMGIILDKLYTTFAFMDFQYVDNYDPNLATYVSIYDSPFGSQHYALSQRVLDNMLGANYDTFPWFRYYALLIYASVTNTNLVGSIELKERIAIKRYSRQADLEAEFGADALAEALKPGNTFQYFVHNGEQYVYTYLPDRAWHLVARKSRSPVSFQYLSEYNEALNKGSTTRDNYGLKVLLAYYEYYNNFSGY